MTTKAMEHKKNTHKNAKFHQQKQLLCHQSSSNKSNAAVEYYA
jgi:hypothetical protein